MRLILINSFSNFLLSRKDIESNIRHNIIYVLGPITLFTACMFIRSPSIFLNCRLWAEEGSIYYNDMQNYSFISGILFVANGNYLFLTNLIVELSLRVDPRFTAVVTTYAAYALAVFCCFLVVGLMRRRKCSAFSIYVACALLAVQPAGYEVFLSATNVQWLCSVATLIICLHDDVPLLSLPAITQYALLVVFGLTGTTSCILMPVFLAAALLRPSAFRWAMGMVLLLTTCVQLGILINHSAQIHRPFIVSAEGFVPIAMQTIWADFTPIEALNTVGLYLQTHVVGTIGVELQIVAVAFALILAMTMVAQKTLGQFETKIMAFALISVSLINVFGSLDGFDGMISGWAGARYFLLANSVLIIMACASLNHPDFSVRLLQYIFCTLFLMNAVISNSANWTRIFLSGPSVAEQVDRCGNASVCHIVLWPVAGNLSFDIDMERARLRRKF